MKPNIRRLIPICILLLFAAKSMAATPTSSCVDYSYEKAKEHYQNKKWLSAYAYLRSTEVCAVHSRFSNAQDGKVFIGEVRALRGEAWDKIHKKKKTGFSLTSPTFRSRPPR